MRAAPGTALLVKLYARCAVREKSIHGRAVALPAGACAFRYVAPKVALVEELLYKDIRTVVFKSPFLQELLVQARPAPCCLNSLDGVLGVCSAVFCHRTCFLKVGFGLHSSVRASIDKHRKALMWRFGNQQDMQSTSPT